MAITAGIDEAGYGPLLGPLVVSAVAIEVGEAPADDDLWSRFQVGHAGDGRGSPTGVKVGDSKAMHRGANGLRILEENVMPFLACLDRVPASFREYVEHLAPGAARSLDDYPWYKAQDFPLPCVANRARVMDRATRLRRALDDARARFCGAWVEPVNPRELNAAVAAHGTKSAALAGCAVSLLRSLGQRWPCTDLDVVADKHGGRNRYAPMLALAFQGALVETERESDARSSYIIRDRQRRVRVTFCPRADATVFTVALASMFSKYTRELFMHLFNRYWCYRVPGLRPTAGYVTDARRFLREIEPVLAQAGTDMNLVLRCR